MAIQNQDNLLSPAEEAARYLQNAKEILSEKAGKKDGLYADVKYVKMAAGTAYSAALFILDEYLKQKEGIKFVKPKSIEDYIGRVRKYDKKLLSLLVDVYDELHLAGYYHGTRSVNTIQTGLSNRHQNACLYLRSHLNAKVRELKRRGEGVHFTLRNPAQTPLLCV